MGQSEKWLHTCFFHALSSSSLDLISLIFSAYSLTHSLNILWKIEFLHYFLLLMLNNWVLVILLPHSSGDGWNLGAGGCEGCGFTVWPQLIRSHLMWAHTILIYWLACPTFHTLYPLFTRSFAHSLSTAHYFTHSFFCSLFHSSFIMKIYIAPLQGDCSGALPIQS